MAWEPRHQAAPYDQRPRDGCRRCPWPRATETALPGVHYIVDCGGVLAPERIGVKLSEARVGFPLFWQRCAVGWISLGAEGNEVLLGAEPVPRNANDLGIPSRPLLTRLWTPLLRTHPFADLFCRAWPRCPPAAVFYLFVLGPICLN